MFGATTEPGRRAEKRLREEKVALLATVRDDRSPQPVPVWFLWDKNAVVHGVVQELRRTPGEFTIISCVYGFRRPGTLPGSVLCSSCKVTEAREVKHGGAG